MSSVFRLPPISLEQADILSQIASNHLIIDSVAGSGKTTTNLYIAQCFPNLSILLLTYNSKLRLETRNKAQILQLSNIAVHTYHSFCLKYFASSCRNDYEMIDLLNHRKNFALSLNFDVIILDESQDLVPLYVKLIHMILSQVRVSGQTRICFLGDKYQCIYQYNKADERYMILADQLFHIKQIEPQISWQRMKLSQSFRLTKPMANFINRCMLKEERILTEKEGPLVKYIICNSFCNSLEEIRPDSAFFHLNDCFKKGYTFSDIFILAPSLKSPKAPCRKFANVLTDNDIPIYVPNFEDEKLDELVLQNKVVFSTFHQAKGLERKVVIVYGFDHSYFTFHKRKGNSLCCPNELYVAVTRASEQLILIHHYQNDYLPFLDKIELSKTCLIIGQKASGLRPVNPFQFKTSVTELVRHLPCEVVEKALSYFEIEEIQNEEEFIEVPVHVLQKEIYYEDISDINGIAIPAYLELAYSSNHTQTQPQNNIIKRTECFMKRSRQDNQIEIPELLTRANYWNTLKSGYNFKLKQVTNFNWLSKNNLDKCILRLKKLIQEKSDFEVEIKIQGEKELLFRELKGFLDCWDGYNIWELKCVRQLTNEHKLQLAVYMYLFESRWHLFKKKISKHRKIFGGGRKKHGKWIFETNAKMNYLLLNVLSNQILKIKSNLRNLREMVSVLFDYKYGDKIEESTMEFLQRNLKLNIY